MNQRRVLLAVLVPALISTSTIAPAAAGSTRQTAGSALDAPGSAALRERRAGPIGRATPVMGTLLIVTVWPREGADTVALLRAMRDARDSVKLVDSLMSIFSPLSELTALNRAAGGPPIHVSPQLMDVLLLARRYWLLSGGNFDPTVAPLARAWGFYGDSGRIPPARELDSLRALVGFSSVEIDSMRGTVRVAHRGMEMDLGGVAKGYALDLARKALDIPDARGIMVDLGGNVLVAGLPPHGSEWRVGVRDPRGGKDILGVLRLDSGAVATSGDYERFYVIDGRRYSHIIDPHTGAPARGTIAATAVGPTGSWSDGLSATLYLAGAERALSLADSLPGVGALIARADASGEEVADLRLSRRMRGLWESLPDIRSAGRLTPLRPAVNTPNP